MKHDPIVDEVRRARQEIFHACDHDLDRLMDRYQQAETKDRERVVSLETLRARRTMASSPN